MTWTKTRSAPPSPTIRFAFVGTLAWNLSWLLGPLIRVLVVRRQRKNNGA